MKISLNGGFPQKQALLSLQGAPLLTRRPLYAMALVLEFGGGKNAGEGELIPSLFVEHLEVLSWKLRSGRNKGLQIQERQPVD